MDVQAVLVRLAGGGLRFGGTTFSSHREYLRGLRAKGGRRVVLIPVARAAEFAALDDLVVDRAHQGTADLPRKLLGQERAPLVRAVYARRAWLVRALRSLLGKAEAQGEENVYLIAVEPPLFDELWEEFGSPDAPPALAPASTAPPARVGALGGQPEDDRADEDPWRRRLAGVKPPPWVAERFIGVSRYAEDTRRLATLAARSREPILLRGPTGTGKDVISHLIHRIDDLSTGKFIAVNCAAIPAGLLEAELFGAVKGAGSGVARRIGLWRAANRGTLFLDEVAELDPALQPKILTALDHHRIRPVGGQREYRVRVRVIAATNRDLYGMVKAGQFMEELYHRLRGFWILTEPLRKHPEDIAPLADWYWRKVTKSPGAGLSREAIAELESYTWPGNVRELRMVISNLHAFFGDEIRIGREHVRAILDIDRRGPTEPRRPSATEALTRDLVWYYRALRLRHLRRLDEVLSAFQWVVKPLVHAGPGEGRMRDSTLREAEHLIAEADRLLDEFEVLCREPRTSFHRAESYRMMRNLLHTLRHFYVVLRLDLDQAGRLWCDSTYPLFDLALSMIHREVNELLREAPDTPLPYATPTSTALAPAFPTALPPSAERPALET